MRESRVLVAGVVLGVVLGLAPGHGAGVAHAERPLRGSLAFGGTTVLTGAGGDHLRLDAALDVKPWSRYGLLLAWRALDGEHDGQITAGLIYEAAAARPRLVIDLHADAGLDLDRSAPLVGGGIRTTVGLVGPLGVALGTSASLVIDGLGVPTLQLQASARVALSW